jgi:hypothetical protein
MPAQVTVAIAGIPELLPRQSQLLQEVSIK